MPRLSITRRALLAGAGATLAPAWPLPAAAQPAVLALRAAPEALRLHPAAPTPAVRLTATGPTPLRLPHGDLPVSFVNDLPVAARLDWRGVEGLAPDPEPVPPGGRRALTLPLRRAGTVLVTVQPAGGLPPAALALAVAEPMQVAADRDEAVLIEEWRIGPDGRAVSPGDAPGDAAALFTVNGAAALELATAPRSRLRLRFINGSQRSVIAIRIPDKLIHVWAIDSRPAAPFPAANSQLVLPPGGRVDAVLDSELAAGAAAPILLHDGRALHTLGRLVGTADDPVRAEPLPAPAPLPAEGLPATLDLAGAVRAALDLAAPPPDAPAFRLARGQIAVVALTNGAAEPVVVRLAGHPARWLDRLDDGWKPFWLDTLTLQPRATERIAFLAAHAGRFPIEAAAPVWGAPVRTAWYEVA